MASPIQRHGVIVAADDNGSRLSSFSEPPEGDGDEDESSDGDGESASGEGDVVGESPDGDGESASGEGDVVEESPDGDGESASREGAVDPEQTSTHVLGIALVVVESLRPGWDRPVVTSGADPPSLHVQHGSPSSSPLCLPSPLCK